MSCIFCKIVKGEIPSEIVYQTEEILAFKDIKPKAPIHFLIIPKKHISSIKSLTVRDRNLAGDLIIAAKKIAQEQRISGFRLVFNVGRAGGQIVEHLHLHFLAGKPIKLP